jgi:hypothetical protein
MANLPVKPHPPSIRIADSLFDPKAIRALLAVFEAICRSLDITSKDDPLAELVALKVVQIANRGERDPNRLRDLVLLALRFHPV